MTIKTHCFDKGPSIKYVHSQGGMGGYPVRAFFEQGGAFFRCGCPHFLAQKTSDILKFMMCLHGQGGKGGLSYCGPIANKEGGDQFFTILCRRLLWTTPNMIIHFCKIS